MNKKLRIRAPKFKISAWYILTLCVFATMLTSHYLSMYSIVHWPMLTSSSVLKVNIEEISSDNEANKLIEENNNLKKFFHSIPDISERIDKSGYKLLSKTGCYRILGLASFILAFFAFFCQPRWVGFIALPLGIYSITMAMVIM